MRYAVDVSSFMMLIFDVFTSEGYPRGEDEVWFPELFL